ncbi:hypothetical protein E4T56_gene2444, partial [Termitomyces sp. T112]
ARFGARRGDDHDPDRALRHPAGLGPARALGRIPQRAHDARRGKSRPPARDHDRAADPVHPAGAVHRHPWPGGLLDRGCIQQRPGSDEEIGPVLQETVSVISRSISRHDPRRGRRQPHSGNRRERIGRRYGARTTAHKAASAAQPPKASGTQRMDGPSRTRPPSTRLMRPAEDGVWGMQKNTSGGTMRCASGGQRAKALCNPVTVIVSWGNAMSGLLKPRHAELVSASMATPKSMPRPASKLAMRFEIFLRNAQDLGGNLRLAQKQPQAPHQQQHRHQKAPRRHTPQRHIDHFFKEQDRHSQPDAQARHHQNTNGLCIQLDTQINLPHFQHGNIMGRAGGFTIQHLQHARTINDPPQPGRKNIHDIADRHQNENRGKGKLDSMRDHGAFLVQARPKPKGRKFQFTGTSPASTRKRIPPGAPPHPPPACTGPPPPP